MKKPYSISMESSLMTRVDEIAGKGKRSQFICEAIEEKLGHSPNPLAEADVQVAQARATVPAFKPASKKIPDKAAVIEDLQKKVDAVAPQMTREQWIKRRIMKPDLRVLPTPTARRIAEKELA